MSSERRPLTLYQSIASSAPVIICGAVCIAAIQAFVYLVKMAQRSPSDDARVRTDMRDPSKISVVQTVSTIASTLVAIITVALAMKRAGLSTESSLGVAAILTIIIALATQSLAQEIVASMVFMFERRAVVGDSVVIYSKDAPTPIAGVVSNIGVSSISVRRMDKSLAHVPFTGISCVVNESENDQLAVVEVPVDAAYGPARAVVEAKRVCDMMRDDENISRFIQGAPYVHGVTAPMPHYFNIVVCVPCRERHKISVTNYTRLVLLSEFARLNIPHPPTVLSIATNPK